MVMKVKESSSQEFELAPAGTHLAVCVAVVDLGTHTEQFGSEPPYDARKIFVAWELTAEPTRPVVGRSFTLSLHTKAVLRQWLKAWRGRDVAEGEEFDVATLIGKPCQITIEHKKSGDRTFGNICALTGLGRGMTAPPAQRTPVVFDLDAGKDPIFEDWMPRDYGKLLEDKIAASHERGGKKPAAQAPAQGQAPAPAQQAAPEPAVQGW